MGYNDNELQQHELNYWLTGHKLPFHHEKFYKEFFNFSKLHSKNVIEIGCGGCPISEYSGIEFTNNLTLLDPLLNSLIRYDRYYNLQKYNLISESILELKTDEKFDNIICLNVIDHFNDTEYLFVQKMANILNENGELWLYYDLRTMDSDDHLAIDNIKLMKTLEDHFDIIKISRDINPTHIGWSNIYESIRLILQKK